MTTRKDDRTDAERTTHNCGVRMTDNFLSGRLCKGKSVAVWACKAEHVDTVLAWVTDRSDARYVAFVSDVTRYRCRCDHLHVYVVRSGHPALAALERV